MIALARRLGPLLLILLTASLIFERLVFEPNSIIVDGERPSLDHAMPAVDRAVGNDLTRFFWPHHLRVWTAIHRDGRLPGWDSSGFGGRPFVGNPQAGLWYPPVWLVWWTQSPAMLSWLTIGHLVWGSLGVLLLARSAGLSRLAGAVAASCWMAAPYILAQTLEGHVPHVWAASWYPWAFWAFRRWRRDGYGWRSAAPLPLFVAATLLTGHPQEGHFLGLTLAIWFVFELVKRFRKGQQREVFRSFSIGVGLFVLALGLIAVEVVPDLTAGSWGLRSGALKIREASRYHVGILNAIQLLSPSALGGPADYFGFDNYWESILSIGFVPLVLLTIALLDSTRRNEVRGLGALVAGSVLFAAGRQWGLYAILYFVLPGLDRFRVPSRALFLANLGAVMLVGLGIDAMRDAKIGPIARRYGWVSLGIAAFVGIGATIAGQGSSNRIMAACLVLVHEPRFLVATIATGILLGAACCSQWARRVLPGALGLLAVGELVSYGHNLISIAPVSQFVGADPIADAIEIQHPREPFRIRTRDTFYPDLPAFSRGLEKVNMNDSFQIQHAARLYQKLYPINEPIPPDELRDPGLARKNQAVRLAILNLMNVAFVAAERSDETLGWPVVARGTRNGRPFVLQRNPDPLPRAYVVPRANVVEEAPTIYDEFLTNSPRETVLMTTDPLSNAGIQRQMFTPARYHEIAADRLSIDVTTSAPGLLVIADTWMPGWSATLDGKPVDVLRGNLAQRVVPIRNAGSHRVEMVYDAPGLAVGFIVTALTLATALVMLVMGSMAIWWPSRG
jgi:hypothetical protein